MRWLCRVSLKTVVRSSETPSEKWMDTDSSSQTSYYTTNDGSGVNGFRIFFFGQPMRNVRKNLLVHMLFAQGVNEKNEMDVMTQ